MVFNPSGSMVGMGVSGGSKPPPYGTNFVRMVFNPSGSMVGMGVSGGRKPPPYGTNFVRIGFSPSGSLAGMGIGWRSESPSYRLRKLRFMVRWGSRQRLALRSRQVQLQPCGNRLST